MVFSSILFLFWFLPVALAVYYLTPARWRNTSALAMSLVFFAWGAPQFVFALVGGCTVDYFAAHWLPKGECSDRTRRFVLAGALSVNVGMLLYFKYANFFVAQLNATLSAMGIGAIAWADVALPIGISFVTFHRVSYLVDVYRGVTPPARNWRDYLLYIALFPQLIAGPIIRYHDVAEQIRSRNYNASLFLDGAWRFALGLGKKTLLANPFGQLADILFGTPVSDLGTLAAWAGALAYSFQIYFDFSGYSDMAIGLGRMMGIRFLENFNFPYISRSITEFWRRWHISLGNFMKEYLYIPLGGNRVAPWRAYLNLWIVFVISGFWHGAAWTFVAWGSYHGLLLTIEHFIRNKRGGKFAPSRVCIPLTFVLVCIGWVFFRSDTIGHAFNYLGVMFSVSAPSVTASAALLDNLGDPRMILALVVGVAAAFAPLFRLDRVLGEWTEPVAPAGGSLSFLGARFVATLALALFSCAAVVNGGFNPFIYFRF
jgi:alginate O-acetyltransferase complex protein AlgI